MHIIGYSERGAVNSLFYEIAYSARAEDLLTRLLGMARFPLRRHTSPVVREAEVLVEQSLSDFGDADAIMLLKTVDGPITVFVEAKVEPAQSQAWRIEDEYQRFVDGLTTKVSSSNLFTQLYHKVRFVSGLRHGGLSTLQGGLPFPPSSTRSRRRIGHNTVVNEAARRITQYLSEVLYLALVPDKPERVRRFFIDVLAASSPADYAEWDVTDYGFICWNRSRSSAVNTI